MTELREGAAVVLVFSAVVDVDEQETGPFAGTCAAGVWDIDAGASRNSRTTATP